MNSIWYKFWFGDTLLQSNSSCQNRVVKKQKNGLWPDLVDDVDPFVSKLLNLIVVFCFFLTENKISKNISNASCQSKSNSCKRQWWRVEAVKTDNNFRFVSFWRILKSYEIYLFSYSTLLLFWPIQQGFCSQSVECNNMITIGHRITTTVITTPRTDRCPSS